MISWIAPKRKKVKAEGSYFYSFESIWKDFAMDYGRMNQDDKYSAFSLVSECFKLQTHEKGDLSSFICIEKF